MNYTEILYLITKTPYQDEVGNILYTESQKMVYAKKNYVGSKEFYNAVAVGITPVDQLQIRLSNYSGEEEVDYNNKRLVVIRTIPVGRTDLVLVLAEKEGINGIQS